MSADERPSSAQPEVPRALPRLGAFVLGTIAVTCALAAPAFAINRFEHSLPSGDELGVLLFEAREVLLWAPLLGPVLVGVYLVVHVRPALARLRRGVRWLALAGLGVVAVVAALAAMTTNVFGQRDWLFGAPRPQVSAVAPDGRRTAHVASDCFFFCSVFVYVEERGDPNVLRRVGVVSAYDETKPLPAIDWAPDSSSFTLRPVAPGTFVSTPATLTFR